MTDPDLQFRIGELQARLEASEREVAALRAEMGADHGRCCNTHCKKCYGPTVTLYSVGQSTARTNCSFCDKLFEELTDGIQTIHISHGYVCLCDECYDKAGNDVR